MVSTQVSLINGHVLKTCNCKSIALGIGFAIQIASISMANFAEPDVER